MNDELSGQLASTNWRIPNYAQDMLWLETESETVQVEGEAGLFELSVPARELRVRFGGEQGAILAGLRWQPDSLEWDGTVQIGGVVDAVHLQAFDALEMAIAVIYFGGHPLKMDVSPQHPAGIRGKTPYTAPDFFGGLQDDIPETVTTWLVADDSPLLTMAQDAMMSKLRVWFSGKLADEGSGWDGLFALPLLLGGVTLFAP